MVNVIRETYRNSILILFGFLRPSLGERFGKSNPNQYRTASRLLVFLFSLSVFDSVSAENVSEKGSENPRVTETSVRTTNSWNDPLGKAQALIEEYEKLDRSSRHFGYKTFQVIFDHIGPVTLINPRGRRYSPGSGTQDADFRNFRLNGESLEMFSKKIDFFKTHSLKATDDPSQSKTFDRAEKIVIELMALTNHSEAYRNYQLAKLYRSDRYRVLKSLKTGFFHLPSEILRFTTAIVIVRLATCFGSSMWNTMSFNPVAKKTDPVCLNELGEMFVDPVFYAGFSSFVLASRASTPAMLKALRMIDPKYGPVSQATARLVIPQFSMAVGFIADHIVKTLLHNKDIQQCLGSMVGSSFALNQASSLGTIEENGEEKEVYDYYRSASCRRAGDYINSDQLLREELGVGIVGLVSAAVSLSVLGAGTSKLIQMSALRLGASFAGKITLVLSATGPIGLIIGLGRMVAFLALAELITPYVNSAYHLNFMEPKLDNKAESLIQEYERVLSSGSPLDELLGIFEEETFIELNVEGKKIKINMGREKRCAEHYSGYRLDGNEPLCTNVPVITEIMSFHDYSKTWRSKKILGNFNMGVTRWKKKLTSFFDNYYSSREQIRYLARGRELYLTGESQAYKRMQNILYANAMKALVEGEGLSEGEAKDVLEGMEEDLEQGREPKYDYGQPRQRAFDFLRIIFSHRDDIHWNNEGDYYYGIYKKDYSPDFNEVNRLIDQILKFIDLGHVTVRSSFRRIYFYKIRRHLKDLGFPPDLIHYPFLMETLRRLLTSEADEDRAYGLVLFKSWAPSMRGSRHNGLRYRPLSSDGMVRDPMGFANEEQDSLYKNIVEALRYYNPLFKYEWVYLKDTLVSSSAKRTKTEDHTGWSDSFQNLDTSKLYAHTLVHLICGPRQRSFINREGLALVFPIPHLLKGNICENLYQPVHDYNTENSYYPSVTKSQFTSPEKLYVGLHQAYIQAPEDEDNPLLFDMEAQAWKWWDKSILPKGIQILDEMKNSYGEMVREEFFPHLSAKEPQEAKSSWERFQRTFFPWVDDGEEQEARSYTSTESLIVSIINELSHYRQTILSLVDSSIRLQMDEKLKTLSDCFSKLLESIPDKKYKEAKNQCKESPESIIAVITYRNGSINQRQVEELLRFDEKKLEGLDDEGKKMLIKNLVLVELSKTLDSLYSEIFNYNIIVNHLFDFNLDKKDLELQ